MFALPLMLAVNAGANLAVDVTWKYLNFFMSDDKKLKHIESEYGSGRMLTGEAKAELIKVRAQLERTGCMSMIVGPCDVVCIARVPPKTSPTMCVMVTGRWLTACCIESYSSAGNLVTLLGAHSFIVL